jgi:uncharacterized protein with LGFP repeats
VQGPVRDRWLASGSETGPLGYPTTDHLPSPDGTGRHNDFSAAGGASIYWSPATGAHSVQGPVRDRWLASGSETGPLGYPTTDQLPTPDGTGRFNHFSGSGGASIYWSPTTGAHSVLGPVRDRWAASGWEGGPLGYPTTDQLPSADGLGRHNDFSAPGGASIYWSPAAGAHSVQGPVRDRWLASGSETGPLGYPTTDQLPSPDGTGRHNDFSAAGGASIYWSPATGAHSILGPVRDRWAATGSETGPLGYPTTDSLQTPDGTGRYNHFSMPGGASIYWSPASGAHSIQGAIRARWADLGWERGLGYPTTDELGLPDGVGRSNHFSLPGGASVYWSPATGAHAVQGAIRDRWAAAGWERGLGYPTTDETGTPDRTGRYNHFSMPGGASIYWSPASGAHSIQGAIRARWADLGWERGLGYPTTDEFSVPGGQRSNLERGALVWNARTGTVTSP